MDNNKIFEKNLNSKERVFIIIKTLLQEEIITRSTFDSIKEHLDGINISFVQIFELVEKFGNPMEIHLDDIDNKRKTLKIEIINGLRK